MEKSMFTAELKVCFESKMSAQGAKALLRVSGAPKALQSKCFQSSSSLIDSLGKVTKSVFLFRFDIM